MNIIFSAYTKKAYKEYILPNVNNTNYDIVFEKQVFETESDIVVNFDVIEQQWRILSGDSYTLEKDDIRVSEIEIADKMTFKVICTDATEIQVSISLLKSNHFFTKKYKISPTAVEINIGTSSGNDIVCEGISFISRNHVKLLKLQDGWYIENLSSNGSVLNSMRIQYRMKLNYGDYINILGLRIVFLEDILAVNEIGRVDSDNAVLSRVQMDSNIVNSIREESEKKLFNRAPRILEELHSDEIEIEAPPLPRQENKKSLLMTIGPAFTMAIPMLLSCFMMIYSSRQSGAVASPFMYTGLITALSSSFLGIFWALLNIRNEKKRVFQEEKQRFESYSDYLMTISEKIKGMYKRNTELLNSRYPDAEVYAEDLHMESRLWNRNISHKDFLYHRIGIGELPFQVDIKIPRDKFIVSKDSLAEKPKLIKNTYSTLKDVPVCVDLKKNRLIGIVGGKEKKGAYEIVRTLSVQIAASNCYTDVKLGYIFSENSFRNQVSFSKWLPHCWSEDKKTRFCASNFDEASDVFYELAKIFRLRDDMLNETSVSKKECMPRYVLFIEDAKLLEGEPISKYVYDLEKDLGVTTIFLAEQYEDLPNSCECILYNDEQFTGVYTPQTISQLDRKIKYDSVSASNAEAFARRLSDIRVAEINNGGEVPASLSFLDMYQVEKIDDLKVLENWKKNRTYENMRALIGQKAGGVGCYLDIHEKYHGPHGLVAGTTGSGKSETLQTYILSLAVNYSPDDIGFLIIDFKGGGMANLFKDLPHMLGQISNLSGNQIRRAMLSIKSENLRRQRIFSDHGVNNINAYTRLLKNNEASVPMPHLFIIIDEFAELKREEPEFMSELISVAQVGRSLGVHLILATQKPGGTVDDNIRSNSKFKLCLRVQDKQDSVEMLGRAEAAYLSQAGRCYLQVGNDEIFELFQSGWSGAVYDEELIGMQTTLAELMSVTGRTAIAGSKTLMSRKDEIRRKWLMELSECISVAQSICGIEISEAAHDSELMKRLEDSIYELLEQMEIDYKPSRNNSHALENFIGLLSCFGNENIAEIVREAKNRKIKLPELKERTQLSAVIEHLNGVANTNGYEQGVCLWMPPLPETMCINDIAGFFENSFKDGAWCKQDKWTLSVPVGLCDDPVNQTQMPLYVDFAGNGHLAVCGNITSGKSTFLQTLIWSLINKYSPAQVNIYALDYSNHMLQTFENYKHVGAVLYENNTEKTEKLFYMLTQMLKQRKEIVRGGNFGQYIKMHGDVLPSIVVVIDNYSSFREKTDNRYENVLWEIARDGASFGMFLAISSGGFGSSEIQAKIADNIRNVVALDMGDKIKYFDVLRTSHIDVLPEPNVKGRGLINYDGSVIEFHTAICLPFADEYKRAEEIERFSKEMNMAFKGDGAVKVPEIPAKPTWTDLQQNVQFSELIKDEVSLPYAYDQRTASVYSLNLAESFCCIIAGKSRTGRTETLKIMACAAKSRGDEVCIVDGSDSQLKRFSQKWSDKYISKDEKLFDWAKGLSEVFRERNAIKRSLIDSGADESTIYEEMLKHKRIFVFVSNFSDFLKSVYTPSENIGNMSGFFENILEKGRLHNIYFVFDINLDDVPSMLGKKLYSIVTGYKTGVHLGGGLINQKIFDCSALPFAEQSKVYKPGVGMAFDSDGCVKVIIPSAKGV